MISKERRALGFQGKLLWKIEGDLPRFKALTTGHPIIMGRKTYKSIGKPLPNRTNIIITRNPNFKPEGIFTVPSLEKALEIAQQSVGHRVLNTSEEIFVIGGGQIYTEAIKFADRLYLTIVKDEPEADTFFPDYSLFKKIISEEPHPDHIPPFSYIILEK